MQTQAANLCIGANRVSPGRKAVGASAFGVARKQERAGLVTFPQIDRLSQATGPTVGAA